MEYVAYVLPHEGDNLIEYANKYSQLKLKGLQQNPDAFSSTYAAESAMTTEQKMARLQLQSQQIIIVAAKQSKDSHWLEDEWVGQVTLVGPKDKEQYFAPIPNSDQRYTFDHADETAMEGITEPNCFFHMTALYVDTNHRRKGIAKILCDKSFQEAANISKSISNKSDDGDSAAEIRIVIAPNNHAVIKMYDNLGFKVALQKSTLAEAIIASGDLSSLVDNYQSVIKYNERIGIIMIKRVSCSNKKIP